MRRPAILLLGLVLLSGPVFAQESASKGPTIPAAEYAQRRASLYEAVGGGLVLIEADPLGRGMDSIDANTPVYDYPYLTGYHQKGDILAILSEKDAIVFSEEIGGKDKLKGVSGISEVKPRDGFEEYLKTLFAKSKPSVTTRLRKEAKELVDGVAEGAGAKVQGGVKIQSQLAKLRMIKSKAEIEMIRKSSDATNKAHLEAMKACKPEMNEKELQTIIENKFKAEGCDGLGFPSIVGSGKNGTVLHYDTNNQPMPADSLVVCDIGASYLGYVTDITRTLPTSGKFTDEHRKAYQCVLDAQKAAEALLKPGATFDKLHRAAAAVFKERGLEDWCYCHSKAGGPRHGLSHYVGMAVHDSGSGGAFKPGVVITIEPGYYSRKGGFGIRIEDMYVVTADGFERLSAGAPREIAEIEKLMGKK